MFQTAKQQTTIKWLIASIGCRLSFNRDGMADDRRKRLQNLLSSMKINNMEVNDHLENSAFSNQIYHDDDMY